MAKIGVVLPVFNGELFIKEAVESILNQSFKDFNLFVIQDGSTDATARILGEIEDDRLRVVNNDGNKGLIYSLNRGLDLARNSEYIARMDADDISTPKRLEIQNDFFDRNQDVGLLGTGMLQFGGGKNDSKKIYRPQSSSKIASTFMFYNPVSHPTVMLRSSLLQDENYCTDFPKYEDYHLWIKLFGKIKFYNLNELLLKYRRHSDNVTSTYYNEVLKDHGYIKKLIEVFSEKVDVGLEKEEIELISIISSKVRYEVNPNLDLKYIYAIQDKIIEKLSGVFDKEYFKYLFQERVFLYFLKLKKYNEAIKVLGGMSIKNKTLFIQTIAMGKKT